MSVPIFRFTLTHQAPEGVVQFNNNGFDVTIFGWDQRIFTDQQPWAWATGGYARADSTLNGYATTGLIGQFRSGGWHPGKYVVDITARNNSGTSGASSPLESSITVRGSQDGISVTTIPDTGNGTWPADNVMRTRRITFELDQYYNYIFFNFIKPGPSTNYDVLIDIDKINIVTAPIVKQISEPDGWKDVVLKLERDQSFYSLVEYFESGQGFIFYGNNGVDDGGIDFIKNVERLYGFNADILIKIELSFDGSVYETVFNGQLDLPGLKELPDNKLEIPVLRNDLWTTFISRNDMPVNMRSQTDINGNSITRVEPVDINFTPQKVQKRLNGDYNEGVEFNVSAGGYIQFGPNELVHDELDDFYNLYTSFNPEKPVEFYAVKEAGSHAFDFRLVLSGSQAVQVPPGDLRNSFRTLSVAWDLYFQINDDTPIAFSKTDVEPWAQPPTTAGAGWTVYTYSATHDLKIGDLIRVYGEENANLFTVITVWAKQGALYRVFGGGGSTGGYANETGYEIPSYFDITAQTVFPETSAQGYLIHDAFAGVIQGITGRNCFYSEYFGSTTTNARQYDSNGCGWKQHLTKGLQIRGYTLDEKPISWSFKDLWEGANPIFNLCLFYDTIDGEEVIRIEAKESVYDKSSVSHNFDNVRIISREYDQELLYSTIEVGYSKWQSEDISGIDDPQGKRVWATIL